MQYCVGPQGICIEQEYHNLAYLGMSMRWVAEWLHFCYICSGGMMGYSIVFFGASRNEARVRMWCFYVHVYSVLCIN